VFSAIAPAPLAAVTFMFLQLERRRRTDSVPTFPKIRDLVREVMAALLWTARPSWLNSPSVFSGIRRCESHNVVVPRVQFGSA
jgi:hypothetical protein